MARELQILVIQVGSSGPPLRLALPDRCRVVYDDGSATGAPDATTSDPSGFDAVVIDARDAPPGGVSHGVQEALSRILAVDARARCLAVVEDGDDATAAVAAGRGAWDVVWATDVASRLPERLRDAARLRQLCDDPREARGRPPARDGRKGRAADVPEEKPEEDLQMIGSSDCIRRVFQLIRQVAPSDVPVLVTGESGTGKELAALALHERSSRADKPFVAINCGAIPEHLLESELFGYEKGAFTGATQARKGRFEAAQGGTIFLDEIGELAPALQVKLLRFLEDHLVVRLGSRASIPLDVRVIAATNRDLPAMVQRGEFREDLYFRLAVFTIQMPPLRARGEDVLLMARYFLSRYAKESPHPPRGYAPEALEALLAHPWPGNVRELVNRVRRAVVVCEAVAITPADLGLAAEPGAPLPTLREARAEAEARVLRAALLRAKKKVEAARLLGISRAQLYELLEKHGIGTNEWEPTSDPSDIPAIRSQTIR